MLKFKIIQNNSNFGKYIFDIKNINNICLNIFSIVIQRNLNNIFLFLQKKKKLCINKISNQKNKNFSFYGLNNLKIVYYQIKSCIKSLFFYKIKLILNNICFKLFFKIKVMILNYIYYFKIKTKYSTILNFKNKIVEMIIYNYLNFVILGI
jgi:hypothetical protein